MSDYLMLDFGPELLSHLPPDKAIQLRRASQGEVATLAIATLDMWGQGNWVDGDDLLYAGLAIGKAGHTGIDADIAVWLNEPSVLRLEIASFFLWGFWSASRIVHEPLVSGFLGLAETLPKESRAYVALMLALSSVFLVRKDNLSEAQFEHGRTVLQREYRVLRLTGMHKGVADTLADLFPGPVFPDED